MAASGKHTIILMQYTQNTSTRTYSDYETVGAACDGICHLFEQRLKKLNPSVQNITYDVSDLFNYIDQLGDLSALVYSPDVNAYIPYNKDWVKSRVYARLKKQAV